jgi:uncharacterized protein (DUF1015 family)
MARLYPFRAYRYSPASGQPADLVTQPYDKISTAMQHRYLSLSPYNLVRVILGERFPDDTDTNNVYTRAAAYLEEWIQQRVLMQDPEPAIYPYFQQFTVPDSGERLTRKGFIALGAVEEYSAGVVHRHEKTLSGPKKDRMQVLQHTHAHFGQIFMLYPDPQGDVDALIDEFTAANLPVTTVTDEYGAVHQLWRCTAPELLARIQQVMEDKKLLIADGHHRYETALAFAQQHPELEDAQRVMMTFVNMHSAGLRILATHRLLHGMQSFNPADFLLRARASFRVTPLSSIDALRAAWIEPHPGAIRIGVLFEGSGDVHLLEKDRTPGELDVPVLHDLLLHQALGIDEEDVREQRHIHYVRGVDAAVEEVRSGKAQAAFLLEPTSVEQVASISFGGGVMPQKSTDFYPKLLSGMAIHKLEK